MHAQVFVITSGFWQYQAFVIQNNVATPLGSSFGWWGLMSMCVTDLDQGGKPELLFTYSWGSGLHRSRVAIWNGGKSITQAATTVGRYDLIVEKIDDSHVHLAYGKFNGYTGEFDRLGDFGTAQLTNGMNGQQLKLLPPKRLPKEVSDEMWDSSN